MKLGSGRWFRAALAVLFVCCFPRPSDARDTLKVTLDGVQRRALIDPGKDAATTPSPLVFVFHGFGGAAEDLTTVGLAKAWPEATFVYPQGLLWERADGAIGAGWQHYPGQYDDRDVRFVDLLLKDLSSTYQVDPRQVYVTGFSNGAIFTCVLLVTRPDRFAAFAPVSTSFIPPLAWAATPRPVLLTHGKKDTSIPLAQAEWVRNHLLRLNDCGDQTVAWDSNSVSYEPCGTGQPVIWSVHNGGHEWYSGTTQRVVRFFQEHALPTAPPTPPEPAALDTSGVVAGGSSGSFGGDSGPATMAQLAFPMSAAPDPFGDLLIADTANYRIRLVSPEGLIVTWVGGGFGPLDPNQSLAPPTVEFSRPTDVVADRSGNLFIANVGAWNETGSVSRLSINDGTVRQLKGLNDLSVPAGLAVDRSRNLYIADSENHRVLKVATNGTVSTMAGTQPPGFSGDAGPATAAQLQAPEGLATDSAGNLYIADTGNHRVRKVAPDGTISTVVGNGTRGSSGIGGKATEAQLNQPCAVAVDSQGSLFVVDRLNYRVIKVAGDGLITTFFGGSGSDAGATAGPRYYPSSVAVDRTGNVLIADPFNHRIWKVVGAAAPGLIAGQTFP